MDDELRVIFNPNNRIYLRNINLTIPPTMKKDNTLKDTLKERHLNKDERDYLHTPEPDFVQSKTGEVCKNACSLPIKDIIIKYK